ALRPGFFISALFLWLLCLILHRAFMLTTLVVAHVMWTFVMITSGLVMHLCSTHFAAIDFAILVPIQCGEFLLALVLHFRKCNLAIAIDIETTLHAVSCPAHDALECQCFDFGTRKY